MKHHKVNFLDRQHLRNYVMSLCKIRSRSGTEQLVQHSVTVEITALREPHTLFVWSLPGVHGS